jgi:predicted ATPase/DNA-binding XRE family transcriptional regulator
MVVAAPRGATSFGKLLRGYRTTAGLSQEALAERAGLSTRAVSDLERGVKTRPHPNTLRMLADALDLDPEARAIFAAASRPSSTAPERAAPATPTTSTLPVPPHPILGRQAELDAALTILTDEGARLLTLTGPGGVGKTRLSLEIAAARAPDTRVTVVELAPLPRGADVTPAIAARLGIRDEGDRPLADLIKAALADEPHLLVLDNCEHVLPGVQALVATLRDVPTLSVLASSRGLLHLQGERLLPLAPLALPGADDAQEAIAESAAVRLFVERARPVRPGFALTESNAAEIADICRRLDGLPLAIELAAAWMRLVTPADLAPMLEKRLRLLTGGPSDVAARHQTLHATIDWSYSLLEAPHQAIFQRLAVFAGGCTFDTVAAVATGGDPFAALEGLDALADQGLITVQDRPGAGSRFLMFEAVRDFALEHLRAAGEESATRLAHAQAMLKLARTARAEMSGADRLSAIRRLTDEHANLDAALDWAIEHAAAAGHPTLPIALATTLWPWCHQQGRHRESNVWLDRALAASGETDSATRVPALLQLANTANNLEDHARAEALYSEVLSIGEQETRTRLVIDARIGLGMVATATGDYDEADAHFNAALALAAPDSPVQLSIAYARARLALASGDLTAANAAFAAARSYSNPNDAGIAAYLDLEHVTLERLAGNQEAALRLATSCLSAFRAFGERRAEAACLVELALLAHAEGWSPLARTHTATAAGICSELGDEFGLVRSIEAAALIASGTNDHRLAIQLLATASAWRDRTGTVRFAWERALAAAISEASEAELGGAVLAEMQQQGRITTLEHARATIPT